MTDSDYEVKWKYWAKKWVVLERRRSGTYKELSTHRKKQPAKDKAKRLAKKHNASLAYYSKDKNDRRVYSTNYGGC